MHRRLLSLARDARLALALTILSGLLAGWLTIGQARGLSLLVDRVFLGGADLAAVTGLLGFLLGAIFLRALLAWVSEVAANRVAVRVKADLRERLFTKLLALGPAYTRGERTGELTAAAVEGVEALDAYFGQYLPQLVITALVPLSVLFFVFPLDWVSALVLLFTAPLIPLFMVLIGKAAEALTKRQYETLGRLSAHFLDSLQGLVTLKQFGRSKDHARSIAESSDRFRDGTLSVLRVTFLSALTLELLATLSTAVIAVEVGLRLLYGHLPFDKAFFLLLLAPEFYIPLRMLGLRFHAGMAGTTAARRIFAILDTPAPTVDPSTGLGAGRGPSTVKPTVEEAVPSVAEITPKVYAALHRAVTSGLVRSAHDLSEGGLAVAAAEMCLGGRLGLEIDLPGDDPVRALFGETTGCLLVEVRPDHAAAFDAQLAGLPFTRLGLVNDARGLTVSTRDHSLFTIPLSSLITAWNTPIQ
jgi:ABC-type multidrug transport system fused ATPase/permease subunit